METCKQVHFVKINPTGNTTAIVLDAVPAGERSTLSRELMRPESLAVEQVAFLDTDPPRPADIAICMMGGEFCGNAVRSAAAWLVFDRLRWQPAPGYGEEEIFSVSCSGLSHNVRVTVRAQSRTAFFAEAEMPLPLSVSPVTIAGREFWRAELPGITHYCLSVPDARGMGDAARREIVDAALAELSLPADGAAGILFWDGAWLVPYVYVKATATLVRESSCGSGTAAVAASTAAREGRSVRLSVRQEGGLIEGAASWENGTVSALSIAGVVEITAEGMAYTIHNS